jgi:putative acetyltransferase
MQRPFRQELATAGDERPLTAEWRRCGQSVNLALLLRVEKEEVACPSGIVPMHIRRETPADHEAVRHVNRLAFGQEVEGRLVDELREGGYARLSLVAEDNGQIVGHIMFSDLRIHTSVDVVHSLALAPLAVAPGLQRQGIGSALVMEGLRLCTEQGHRIVVVVGHTEYYPRFGFSPKLAEPLVCSFYSGPALMAVELVPGALQGVSGELQYAPPFQNV